MNISSLKNPYSLLALFLSPWKDSKSTDALASAIEQGAVDWGRLLYMANLQFCTPLWYACLRKDGFLPLIPPDLQKYLHHLHEANIERNDAFRQAIIEIFSSLQEKNIPAILLKGGADLCDNLHGDPGARVIGDIDLLVEPRHAERVQYLLLKLGYIERSHGIRDFYGYFQSNAPHHLARLMKPGSPVEVEIHFQAARGQAGRVLTNDLCWKNSERTPWEGLSPYVLIPTYRLLLNTVHALVPNGMFYKSVISLLNLADFNYLAHRDRSVINWQDWLNNGAREGLGRQFRIYLALANKLMGMPFPRDVPGICLSAVHVCRISGAANNAADDGVKSEKRLDALLERMKRSYIGMLINIHRRLNKPVWVWNNFCYKNGMKAVPQRLFYFFSYFLHQFRHSIKT